MVCWPAVTPAQRPTGRQERCRGHQINQPSYHDRQRGGAHTPRYGWRACAGRKSWLDQRCSSVAALLHGSRKLPRDVLQGCYSATEAVTTGLRCSVRVSSVRPLDQPIRDRIRLSTGFTGRSVPLARRRRTRLRAFSAGQNVLGGRALKRRGSKNQTSMTALVTAAAIQQAAVRAGGESSRLAAKPASSNPTHSAASRRTTGQLRRSNRPHLVSTVQAASCSSVGLLISLPQ